MRKIRLIAFLLAILTVLTFAVSCVAPAVTTDGDTTTDKGGTTDKPGDDTGNNGNTGNTGNTGFDPTDGNPEEMPVFHINTQNGEPITSKEVYLAGDITVSNVAEEYAMEKAELEIRGRGNYSWTGTEKKSYRIKFAEKTNLLGQGYGPARSWTLLAVHCDQSMLRTAAAFYFARSLSGIDYTSSVRFAKVYLNGEYLGVYQVSEQMQVHEYRVNIDDTHDREEIDFLVELDQSADEVPMTVGINKYEIKSDFMTMDQYDYIRTQISDAWETVLGGDQEEIEELMDIDSVVDTYIVEELFKNLDAGWGSFYMYKEVGGKLHFGPVWDFDLSTGNADDNYMNPFFPMPQYLYTGSSQSKGNQVNYWFVSLMENEWFWNKVAARWDEITEELNAIVPYIKTVAEMYSEEFDSNFERWPIFGQKINREPAQVRALKSHDEHVAYVCDWLTTRIEWMGEYFDGEVEADPEPGASPYQYKGSGGKGTVNDPYLVSKPADFAELTKLLAYSGFEETYFKQTADIDMTKVEGYRGVGGGVTFAGIYNGNGYTINAVLNGYDECIFPYVTGTVINVITTGSVTNRQQAAGITRSVRDGGAIINCISYMAVKSTEQNAGGIAASNQRGASIINCVFMGTLAYVDQGGPINCFMPGRDGNFSGNYYLEGIEGNAVGTETAFAVKDLATAVTKLNVGLTSIGGQYRNMACRFKGEDGKLVLEHK